LKGRQINFEEPIQVVTVDASHVDIVFTAPGALDPNLVVDPPDIRVRIALADGVPELLPCM
jgi:hypothetical protein